LNFIIIWLKKPRNITPVSEGSKSDGSNIILFLTITRFLRIFAKIRLTIQLILEEAVSCLALERKETKLARFNLGEDS
jgi:hypothetical protein